VRLPPGTPTGGCGGFERPVGRQRKPEQGEVVHKVLDRDSEDPQAEDGVGAVGDAEGQVDQQDGAYSSSIMTILPLLAAKIKTRMGLDDDYPGDRR
jgi:hypothetical protein